MATNHTTNYALNLWEPQDDFLREEFNENSEKLDAAVGALQAAVNGGIATGSFSTALTEDLYVDLGFRPRLVVGIGINYFTVACDGAGTTFQPSNGSAAQMGGAHFHLTDSGFRMPKGLTPNYAKTCYYIAFR